MTTSAPVPVRLTVAALLVLSASACAWSGRNPDDNAPTGYGITFFEPFDNSRDWGPGFLAGPPPGTLHYEHDQASGTYQHPLVHTDTNGTPPSIPDATRSPDNSDKSDKSQKPASDIPGNESSDSTTGTP